MNKKTVIRILFIAAGIILIADTVFIRQVSGWNLGVALPALLGAPLLLYGILKPRADVWMRRGIGKFVKWFFICGYIAFVIIVAVFSVMMTNAAKTEPSGDADAVIVLGAGIRGDQPTFSLQNRLDKAIEYWEQNTDAVIVVTGGKGLDEDYSESYVMEKYLIEKGVPQKAILKEEKSTSTQENFRYAKELLDAQLKAGYKTVYVTNDFHILRAGINAETEGFSAQGLAAKTPLYIAPNCYAREALALLYTFVFGA